MRQLAFGVTIFVLGFAALAIWGAIGWAPQIQAAVRLAAQDALTEIAPQTDLTLSVSGRDINVSGLATNEGGAAKILQALGQVAGHRVLRSDLQDLPVADPFVLTAQKDGAITAQGVVPNMQLRAELAGILGNAAQGLTLAAGMPQGWDDNARAGLAALSLLQKGRLSVEGQTVLLAGEVMTAADLAAVDRALANVAMQIKDVAVLDDGQPIAYTLHYSAGKGGTLTGKLPFGVTPEAVAQALGLPSLSGDVKTTLIRETGDIRYLSVWAGAFSQIDSLIADVSPQMRRVQLRAKAGADLPALVDVFSTGGFVVDIAVAPPVVPAVLPEILSAPAPAPENTPVPLQPDRANAADDVANGRGTEPLDASAPAIDPIPAAPVVTPLLDQVLPRTSSLGFEITPAGCQGASDALLAETTIIFLPNLDTLDESATQVLNDLAAIARDCAGGDLQAEIGGHTDTSGDAAENLALSARRAEAVRAALIVAGVPPARLSAKGYGASQPMTENDTKEGRAKNRRTTVVWRN